MSRALNPETRKLVNEDTARRVLEAAAALDYRPNPIARGLKTNRSYTIGVLVPDLMNPLFPPIVRGIEDRSGAGRLHAADREHRQQPRARAQRLRGDARAPGRRRDHRHRAARPRAARRDGRRPGCRSCSSTGAWRTARCRRPTVDDREGARLAVDHLVGARPHADRPPRRPAGRLDGPRALRGLPRTRWRRPGWRSTRELVRFGRAFTEPRGRAAVPPAARRAATPTAIVAGNDLMALGCYDVFAERGARLPARTSPSSASTTCRSRSASTRRSPRSGSRTTRSGHAAARAAARTAAATRRTRRRQVVLTPELVVRLVRSAPPTLGLDNAGDRTDSCTRLLQTFASERVEEERGWGSEAHALRCCWSTGAPSRSWSAAAEAMTTAVARGTSGGRQPRRRTQPIKIGASLPLTGDFSEPGKAAAAGLRGVGGDDQREGRPARPPGPAASSRTTRRNQNTVVADYNALISQDKVDLLLGTFSSLLNLPASAVAEKNRMLYVEPAGGAPEHLQPRLQDTSSSPSRRRPPHQGDVFVELGRRAAGRPAAEDRGLPDARRPVRAARRRRASRRSSRRRASRPSTARPTRPTPRTSTRSPTRSRRKNPDLVVARRDVRGRRRPDPRAAARSASRRSGSTRPPRRRSATSTPRRSARRTPRASSTRSATAQEAKTPGNPEFVAKYQEMFGERPVPEDAADAFAAAEVLQAAVEAVGGDRPTSSSSPTGCAPTRCTRSSGR